MLKFFYNGIKDSGGKLQRCWFSGSMLINHPAGTITIYKRDYSSFSDGVHAAFKVQNDTEIQTDYFEKDRIRVEPSHPLYALVLEALRASERHAAGIAAKRQRKIEQLQAEREAQRASL